MDGPVGGSWAPSDLQVPPKAPGKRGSRRPQDVSLQERDPLLPWPMNPPAQEPVSPPLPHSPMPRAGSSFKDVTSPTRAKPVSQPLPRCMHAWYPPLPHSHAKGPVLANRFRGMSSWHSLLKNYRRPFQAPPSIYGQSDNHKTVTSAREQGSPWCSILVRIWPRTQCKATMRRSAAHGRGCGIVFAPR